MNNRIDNLASRNFVPRYIAQHAADMSEVLRLVANCLDKAGLASAWVIDAAIENRNPTDEDLAALKADLDKLASGTAKVAPAVATNLVAEVGPVYVGYVPSRNQLVVHEIHSEKDFMPPILFKMNTKDLGDVVVGVDSKEMIEARFEKSTNSFTVRHLERNKSWSKKGIPSSDFRTKTGISLEESVYFGTKEYVLHFNDPHTETQCLKAWDRFCNPPRV